MKTRPHGENTAGTQSIAFGERTLHYMVSRLCTQNGVNEIHKATQLHNSGFIVRHLFSYIQRHRPNFSFSYDIHVTSLSPVYKQHILLYNA